MNTFKDWLLKQHDRHDAVGDLARDVKQDREFPPGIRRARAHLVRMHACDGAERSLEEAWKEYTDEQKHSKEEQL